MIVVVKVLAKVVLFEFFLHQVQLLRKVDEVEGGIDRELIGAEAAAADEAHPGGQPPLDPDVIADLADDDVSVGRGKKDRVLLDQVDVEELEVAGDGEPVFRDSIDINDHGFSLKKFTLLYHLPFPCQREARVWIRQRAGLISAFGRV